MNDAVIGNEFSNYARALDDPGRIEGKQTLKYLTAFGDAYLDEASAANARKIAADIIITSL